MTQFDRDIEKFLRAELSRERPDDAVTGEEFGGSIGAGRTWVLDPIDGTAEFVSGRPGWGNLITLLDQKAAQVAVACQPVAGRVLTAVEGGPTLCNGAPIRMTDTRTLARAIVNDNSRQSIVNGEDHPLTYLATVCASFHAREELPWIDVLFGRADLALIRLDGGGPWDWYPIGLLAKGAGGLMTDLDGQPYSGTGFALLSNGHIHDEALAVVRKYVATAAG